MKDVRQMAEQLDVKGLNDWGFPFQHNLFIAGPCSAESEDQMIRTARGLKGKQVSALRAGIWKPRTRPGSFEGVGEPGLKWLKTAGKELGVPVCTEVATPEHVELCLKEEIDILWVGARTTSNPFAVQAVADALKGVDIPVLVKNPINPDLELWLGGLERLETAGIKRLGAIHRGFSTYEASRFRNRPIWRIPIELKRRQPELPVICDPSHICGNTELLPSVAQNAMDLLFNGLMLEVHIDPPSALSDAKQQLTPDAYEQLVKNLKIKHPHASSLEFMQQINELRNEIDNIDYEIIDLLGQRMENAKKIAFHKMRSNVSLFQPGRWEEVIETRVKRGHDKKLAEEFVLKMYQYIHEESLRLQEEVLKA